MPELKPCPNPKCGITSKMLDLEPCGTDEYAVQCRCCGLCGPVGCPGEYDRHNGEAVEKAEVEARENAISAWNALPRALRWTTEPPEVIGWYFRRFWRGWVKNRWDTPDIIYVDNEQIKRGVRKIGGTQWAGPIPAPVEDPHDNH